MNKPNGISNLILDLLGKESLDEHVGDSFGVASVSPALPMTTQMPQAQAPIETNAVPVETEVVARLSPESLKTLILANLTERLMNEEMKKDDELEKHGMLTEGKITQKGKDYIKKFLPTIYAS